MGLCLKLQLDGDITCARMRLCQIHSTNAELAVEVKHMHYHLMRGASDVAQGFAVVGLSSLEPLNIVAPTLFSETLKTNVDQLRSPAFCSDSSTAGGHYLIVSVVLTIL